MSPLFQDVLDTFAKAGWSCRQVEGREVVESEFEAHHGKVFLHLQTFPEIGAVSVVAEAEGNFSPAQISSSAELLMRANLQLSVGAFELDWDTGRVTFRASNVFADRATPDLIASLVRTTVVEMDRLTPHLAILRRHEGRYRDIPGLLAREDLLPGDEKEV